MIDKNIPSKLLSGDYMIKLNFLPYTRSLPEFVVFRKQIQFPLEKQEDKLNIRAYSLPHEQSDIETRGQYWVSLDKRDGFEKVNVLPHINHDLTKWVIFKSLLASTKSLLNPEQYKFPKHSFFNELVYPLRHCQEGQAELIVQPYYLRAIRLFGLLVDYHFSLNDGVNYSRQVQKLSLSLDKNYKRNLNYYVDRFSLINKFVNERWDIIGAITLPGNNIPVELSKEYQNITADRLRSRYYVFNGGIEARSQFNGLFDHGPLEQAKVLPIQLLFVFREQDRQYARTLAMSLKGSKQQRKYAFPGFEKLFKCDIQIDSNPMVVPEFSKVTAQKVLEKVKSSKNNIVPIFILPNRESSGYFDHKAVFAEKGIATQVCTLPIIQDENVLRWSVANIALQIFCKAGGSPWKVRATSDKALIIGISQSHKLYKKENNTRVEKYFAFSVFTDNSGLFQRIQVLGEGEQESDYLNNLRNNLRNVIKEQSEYFSRIVIHTSFRLKQKEIRNIRDVVKEAAAQYGTSGSEFAVLKINNKSKFFGVNPSVNSLVPYEGTRVRLGYGEYLVWFEGIFPDKRTVTKLFPGPTHIQILYMSDDSKINDFDLLQDLMNLSGANWRGFNAKSAPVSVFYCHLVADLVHEFHDQNLPMPAVEQLRPWFL